MRLENMLDINHELIKLSKHIDRESLDKEWGALFVSTKGAPAIRTRLIAGLHYLKHLHDLSDEQVVKGWTENPYWQYFCGEEYFQHKMPIHPTTMTKWRNRPGKSGSEKLLIETIKAGLKSKTIKPGSLKKVTVDTTVQEKNIAFPTDSKLLNKARENLVKLSKEHGIKLRQNYNRVGPQYVLMASRYAHAKQFKRMKKMNNKLKSRLDRCYLKGAVGDAINVVMVAAGHNLRKILNKLRLLWFKIISGLMGSFIKPGQSAALNLA